MADQTGLTPAILRRREADTWTPCAPLTTAAQVIMPDGTPLLDYAAGKEPDQVLITISHNLDGYPLVLLLSLQYGAGIGGAGIPPAGGTDPVQFACRAIYHSKNSLTVYTVTAIAALGTGKTLAKISPNEYMVTFDGISAESMYVKLILNMGGTVG